MQSNVTSSLDPLVHMDYAANPRSTVRDEQLLQFTLQTAKLGMWRVDTLQDNRLYMSEVSLSHFGLPADAHFTIDDFFKTIHSEDRSRLEVLIVRELTEEAELTDDYRCIWPDGSVHWIRGYTARVHDTCGSLSQIVGTTEEITEKKRAEHEHKLADDALRESNQILKLALESGHIGSWQLDLRTMHVVQASDLCKAHFGLTSEADLESISDVFKRIYFEDRDTVQAAFGLLIESGHSSELSHRVVWPDASIHWLCSNATLIYGGDGAPIYAIGMTQDITRRKELEAAAESALQAAKDQADRDPLTGLLNHRTFHKRLYEAVDEAHETSSSIAIAIFDLDNFRFFNDAYGHVVGDEVLRMVADALRNASDHYLVTARFGGDEFVVIMDGIDPTNPEAITSCLSADLSDLGYQPEKEESVIPITASIGFAIYPETTSNRHDLLRIADERLYRAKTGGDFETEADRMRTQLGGSIQGFSMLDALVTAVDNKDRYTRKHSEEVMLYSRAIARELGMDEDQEYMIGVAALLHDVGKIGIPDAILRKPAQLTESEYEAVKQHPQMGAIMVTAVPGLEGTLDAVRHHHERWDGNGYPFGLRGLETPISARLMAVADAYSAMTTDRPYRKGMHPEKAMSIIERGSGVQWDPDCVAAALRVFRQIK